MKEHLRPGRPRKIRPIEDVLIKATEAVASMPSITNPPAGYAPDNPLGRTPESVLTAMENSAGIHSAKAAFEPHSVIQVRVEPNRGSLWQIGEVENDTVHAYRLLGEGACEYGSFKVEDVTPVSAPIKGMVARPYKRPESAPSWRGEDPQ